MLKIMKKDEQFVEYLMKKEERDRLNKLVDKKKPSDKYKPDIENLSTLATNDNSMMNQTKVSFPKIMDNTFYGANSTLTSNNFFKSKVHFNPNVNNLTTKSNSHKGFFNSKEKSITKNSFYPLRTAQTAANISITNNDDDKFRSSKRFINLSNATNSNFTVNNKRIETEDPLNRSTISFNKFMTRMKKTNENKKVEGNLLHVDYSQLYKRKIDIKNKDLKQMWDEVDHYGPRFAHCNTCFNKNLDFFENINVNDGVNIINFIKIKKGIN